MVECPTSRNQCGGLGGGESSARQGLDDNSGTSCKSRHSDTEQPKAGGEESVKEY